MADYSSDSSSDSARTPSTPVSENGSPRSPPAPKPKTMPVTKKRGRPRKEGDKPKPSSKEGKPKPSSKEGGKPKPSSKEGGKPKPSSKEGDKPSSKEGGKPKHSSKEKKVSKKPPVENTDEKPEKRSRKEEDDVSSKPKKPRKTRGVPDKPLRFVIDEDNFIRYKVYIEHLLKYETARQWMDRMKRERRRQVRMARDWKKRGDVDIESTVKNYETFLADSGYDFSEFDGKWLTVFGIEGVHKAKDLKKGDFSKQPIQFHAALTIFKEATSKGAKPLGIYAANLDTYENGLVSKGSESPKGNYVYVGPRLSLKKLDPHPMALPTSLKVSFERVEDVKLGVGEPDF